MKTHDFWYDLPEELIAQTPLQQRDSSRLCVLDRNSGQLSHRHFYDILDYLQPGDCLVMNDSRVLPARLLGHRPTGGAVELLLLKDLGNKQWECLAKPGRMPPLRLASRTRLLRSPEAVFLGRGSKQTISPTSMPSLRVSAAEETSSSRTTSVVSQFRLALL